MTKKVRVGGFVERWFMGNVAGKYLHLAVVNCVGIDVILPRCADAGGRERTSSKKSVSQPLGWVMDAGVCPWSIAGGVGLERTLLHSKTCPPCSSM